MGDCETALVARVTGLVQGVGFRAWTRNVALKYGLVGWVCNEADGSVHALICGPGEAVAEMLALLKEGPPAARVDAVTTQPADNEHCPAGFRIER